MPDRVLQFGLVGCGRVSESHFAALTSGAFPARLVAVADTNEAARTAKAAKYGVEPYADIASMLRTRPDIDVVTIATPTGFHPRHVVEAAAFMRHIVVEKPMALRVGDARAMMRAVHGAGKRLFVVKQNRFNPAVQAAREAWEQGRFGKPVLGTVRLRWRREQAYYDDGWHGTWALDGGVMSQQASHHLDLLQWFFGPVETVQCNTAARLSRLEAEDTATALVRFASGALGIFEATTAARPDDLEASFSILGEKGSVIIGGKAVNRIDHWKFQEPLPGDETVVERFSQDVPHVYGRGHGPYYGDVVEAILTGRPGLVEAADGLTNVRILAALYESAACGGAPRRPGCPVRRSRLGEPRPDTALP